MCSVFRSILDRRRSYLFYLKNTEIEKIQCYHPKFKDNNISKYMYFRNFCGDYQDLLLTIIYKICNIQYNNTELICHWRSWTYLFFMPCKNSVIYPIQVCTFIYHNATLMCRSNLSSINTNKTIKTQLTRLYTHIQRLKSGHSKYGL